ncbi:Cupin 2 conserved barrel domain protein [Shewanella halifaxensis HAW-EB4]|uniref:Cupin 2 conserved barrel domain protein n=1 Tax=Shewanella halifaxensis (strain HAW-EB4) TaxID=458817 RepID=B0TTP7_SHEHH|nr:cupin domain-containing protein [Shewanella halifaxensis]ABZ75390.1 Cupin 2 conserved barrel domain protein [Shewanella halifaxensis HAW-EB4]
MQKHNILKALPQDLIEEAFEPLVEQGELLIERIISKAHITPLGEWYDQHRSEWVMVMQGAARLEFIDGEVIELGAGEYLNIPAHVKHRVAWTCEEVETIWLAVHY